MSRSLAAAQTVLEGRKATEAIFRGTDDRLIVVVGYVILVASLAPFLKKKNFHQPLLGSRCRCRT